LRDGGRAGGRAAREWARRARDPKTGALQAEEADAKETPAARQGSPGAPPGTGLAAARGACLMEQSKQAARQDETNRAEAEREQYWPLGRNCCLPVGGTCCT